MKLAHQLELGSSIRPSSSVVIQYGSEMVHSPVLVGAVEKLGRDTSFAVRLVVDHDDGGGEVEIVRLQRNRYCRMGYAEKCWNLQF